MGQEENRNVHKLVRPLTPTMETTNYCTYICVYFLTLFTQRTTTTHLRDQSSITWKGEGGYNLQVSNVLRRRRPSSAWLKLQVSHINTIPQELLCPSSAWLFPPPASFCRVNILPYPPPVTPALLPIINDRFQKYRIGEYHHVAYYSDHMIKWM